MFRKGLSESKKYIPEQAFQNESASRKSVLEQPFSRTFILEANVKNDILERVFRKAILGLRKAYSERSPVFQNRLSKRDFWIPERCSKKAYPKEKYSKTGFLESCYFQSRCSKTLFLERSFQKKKKREVQCAEMYLAQTVGRGECWNLCRRWKSTFVGTFDHIMW